MSSGHYPRRRRRDRRGAMTPKEVEAWNRGRDAMARELGIGPPPPPSPEPVPASRVAISLEDRDVRLLAAWNALRPGDVFRPMGGAEQTVRRKSRYSVTDTNGVRWTAGEVLGVREGRMRGLIDG